MMIQELQVRLVLLQHFGFSFHNKTTLRAICDHNNNLFPSDAIDQRLKNVASGLISTQMLL